MTTGKAVLLKVGIAFSPLAAVALYHDWRNSLLILAALTGIGIWVWMVDRWVEWLRR